MEFHPKYYKWNSFEKSFDKTLAKKMHNNYIPSTCSFTLCMYNPTNGINIHSKFDEQNQITGTKFHISTNPQKVTFYDLNIIKVKRPGTAKIFFFLFSIVLKCWIALSEGSTLFCLKQKNMCGDLFTRVPAGFLL